MYTEYQERFYEDAHVQEATKPSYRHFFTTVVAPLEQETGLEFYDIPIEQIYAQINSKKHASYSAIQGDLTAANTYRRWFGSTQRGEFAVRGQLTMLSGALDIAAGMKEELFFGVDELLSAVSKFPVEDGYIDALILALLWYGFQPDELAGILESETNLDAAVPTIRDRAIDSRRVVDDFRLFMHRDRFLRNGKEVVKAAGPELIRRVGFPKSKRVDDPLTKKDLKAIRDAHRKEYTRLISWKDVMRSGVLDRIYRISLEHEPNESDFAKQIQFNSQQSVEQYWFRDFQVYRRIRAERDAESASMTN